MKTNTPDSPYDGSEEEELSPQPATPKKHENFSELNRPQREVVVEGSYTSFMKALALTLANIIMITVIIYAIKVYFAVKEASRELHEIINQFQ